MPPRQLTRLTTLHRRKVRRRPCSAFRSNQWDTTTEQLIAGQQTALGISIQGISQKQLETLKTRMEATKAKLEQAKAAPQSQRESILQGLTGEHLTGDMLTATVWGYFASLQSYGAIAGSQAQIIDLPALSYGLFHAQVKPRKLYGIVTNGIQFQGLNMDVGHLRSIRWVKDDNPQSKINNKPELAQNGKTAAQNRWIAYNKAKGQYSSAMEHAVPEEFWVDKSQCKYVDKNGQVQNPLQAACAEGVSAVKAIAIAQSQGQKIYNINKENRDTALPKLTIGGAVGDEIRNAINAGKEVTFHENAINAFGWSGHGYIILDPETGVGAHLIDGGGSGGVLEDDNSIIAKIYPWVSTIVPSFFEKMVSAVLGGLFVFYESLDKLWDCDDIGTIIVITTYSVIALVVFSLLAASIVGGLVACITAQWIINIVIGSLISNALSFLIDEANSSASCNKGG